ncbi:uncharacterized protein UDID_18032 [Ustilago sp. UG-2017a]|nr:uncharacterized protein UDID_18032 [Ustilago sp. UG-2017a]
MWLRDHPVVSKHLHPCALQGMFLGFSNAPCAIRSHKVWLPELNRIVITRDGCFSEFEQPGTDATPSYMPVLDSNSKLLQSYIWLPQNDTSDEAESDNAIPPSLQPYSCHRDAGTHSNSLDHLSFDHEWDQMMMEIEEVGEVVVDLNTIAADLEAELNAAVSKGGSTMQDPIRTDTLENVPLLETPAVTQQ